MQEAVKFSGQPTQFFGYDTLQKPGRILAIYKDGSQVSSIEAGTQAVIVLDQTPFYAESGGQVGDSGLLSSGRGQFIVENTQKIQAEVFGHHGLLQTGRLSVGDTVNGEVNPIARQSAANNHSATHLLHAALRQVLGTHVSQKGSLVDATRTRFDFSHPSPLTPAQIQEVEKLVNREIRGNHEVETRLMKPAEAIKAGALALFGEKYGDEVRVIGMGEFSTELCGGTHVSRIGEIGFFKIVLETGIAAGVRRIEAVTGEAALAYIQQQQEQLQEIAGALKVQPQEAVIKLGQVMQNVRALEKELGRLKSKLATSQGGDLISQAITIGESKLLVATLEGADQNALRETLDKIKDKLKSCVAVLAAVEGERVSLVAGVSNDLTQKIKAGELVNFVAQQIGGKGGGRPDMAQAGGTQPDKLGKALETIATWVEQRLQ